MKQETRKVDMTDQEKEGEKTRKLNIEDQPKEEEKAKKLKLILLIINCVLLSIGTCVGPLVMRLYFIHGGKRVWLSSFLETAGFPVMIIPLAASYINHRKNHDSPPPKIISMKPPLFFISAILGIIVGFDDYLYAYGVARLPVSTSALIIASQLAFTAVFAYFLVKHKFTAYSINAVVVLTIGAGVLALNTSGDLPHGESHKEYVMGFIATVLAAVIYGFLLPLIEFVYQKIKQPLTYSLVLEIQFVLCLFATLFCVVGMIVNNDFKVIPREAREFELGEVSYYVVMVASGIIWQTFYLGAIGVIFSGSSLLSAVLIAVFLPVTEVFAVIFYKEKFQAEKGVSLVLSLWGFVSYFYGESKQTKKQNENRSIKPEIEGQTRGTSGL